MYQDAIKILAVDDEMMNLDLMEHILIKAGYQVHSVGSGELALDYLQKYPDEVDLVLLDRMMPGMDGMEVLQRIHKHPVLRDMPVIMQTAAVGAKEIEKGISQGAYYYLTKPFREDMLLAVVSSASEAARYRLKLKETIQNSIKEYSTKYGNHYEVKTFEDVQALSAVLSTYFSQQQNASIVLYELMLNALEHGNLGMGYDIKKKTVTGNVWREEIERRLNLPENAPKTVNVTIDKTTDKVVVTITDQGKGFDWSKWIHFDPHRATDVNGRGIAKAHIMGMKSIEYIAPGNQVRCEMTIPTHENTESGHVKVS
ncbi:MAG: response regulator [Alphaproteobacteria bacterium]|nr:response regulator [Alphaproteobacteria bacterium]